MNPQHKLDEYYQDDWRTFWRGLFGAILFTLLAGIICIVTGFIILAGAG
jgi:hypothetical protein